MNKEIAKIFYRMADYLEIEGVAFKPQAYKRAGMALDVLREDVEDIYKKEGAEALEKIPGVGKSLAEKIVEYIKTSKIKEYNEKRKKLPIDFDELTAVEGLGPKKIKVLYEKLKIKNLADLEKAAKAGKISELEHFGQKTSNNILESIEFAKRGQGRYLLGDILPVVNNIIQNLNKLKEVKVVSPVGSIRRMKETVGDVDILVIADNPKKVMDYFVSMGGIEKIWAKGSTKSSVRMAQGFDVDLRILPEESYGAALQYFTGSKEHNIALRKIAIDKRYKLNEYGLFKGVKMIAGKDEKDIYEKLGLAWIPSELRENSGEIEEAQKNKLPNLVELKDIKGDLHIHSNWNGGEDSIEELAQEAMNIGYEYIGIADHTKSLKIEYGLDEEQLKKRNKEIDKINLKLKTKNSKLRILCGCEANILADGSIDISDEALAKLDFVIAGVHSQMNMDKKNMTSRIIKAMENPNVDIISHLTGRILKQRDEYELDFDEILRAAKNTNTILEINAYPSRLDLKDVNIKKAKEAGVKMIINTDSHHKGTLNYMGYGVFQARRGWAEKEDIINCLNCEKMLKMLK